MKHGKKFLIFMTVLTLICTAGLLSCRAQVSSGGMAPDFTLKDVDGRPFNFSATRGKVVILDFWATWCPPCRMEIPHFQALYEKYRTSGLVVVGVALDRGGAEAVKPFIEEQGVTYPILIGDQAVTVSYGGIRGIPTTFMIGRDGRIAGKVVGYKDKEYFEAEIKKLL